MLYNYRTTFKKITVVLYNQDYGASESIYV